MNHCWRSIFLLMLLTVAAGQAATQALYKYQGDDGVWIYTDRVPDGDLAFEQLDLGRRFERPEVSLRRRPVEGGVVLVADNRFHAPVQIGFQLTLVDNLAADTPWSGDRIVPARTEVELLTVLSGDPSRAMRFEYQFRFLPGDPSADHLPGRPYRLPYALARSFEVSQAAPDQITHTDAASAHAIDFAMPVGSGVYAARSGVVIDVASDYFDAGLDPVADGPRANIVRVLHEDGTMALYAHLNWNSIRVVPGQQVARGEQLADSGNTGFSSGPHLHFVVQRNRGGALESVPVQFMGAAGQGITLRRGDAPTAY